MGPLVVSKSFVYKFFIVTSLLIAGYFLIHFTIVGITTKPSEGDSVLYHIPMARSIVSGEFLHPNVHTAKFILYPASNEVILAGFIKLGIPLNLFNVTSIVVLFFVLMYVGSIFQLEKPYRILLGLSVCALYGMLRWLPTQKIDIWLLIYFLLAFSLLNKPKNTTWFYVILGFFAGMIVGSKYSAPGTLLILFSFYGKNFLKYINIKRILAFIIPVLLFGGFWYIRNYIATGDPMYPQPFLFAKGDGHNYLSLQIWQSVLSMPKDMINVFISEYMIWSVGLVVLPIFLIVNILKKQFKKYYTIHKIILLGIAYFGLYMFFPGGNIYGDLIFGFRYTFPAVTLFLLALFLLAKEFHKEDLLVCIVIANMSFLLLPFTYHPKFIYLYVVVVASFLYIISKFLERRKLTSS